jgi:hypothetical protein
VSAKTIPQFALANSIGRSKVYDEINARRLTARKVGNRTIITDEDETDWLRKLPKVLVGGSKGATA